MTVRELSERMDSREFSEWLAMESIDPLPDHWFISAFQQKTMCDVHLGKAARNIKISDFLPFDLPETETEDVAAMRELAMWDGLIAAQKKKA